MMHEPRVPPKLSVVIPCYNEEAVIQELHRRVTRTCRSLVGDSYELVLVNDGSLDHTWAMLQAVVRDDDRIVAVDLSRNYGHQLALSAGLALARGERILIIDADLQDPPELLPDMMHLMDNGADVVYGQRRTRSGENFFKRVSAAIFYRFIRTIGDRILPADARGFRL